MKNFLNLFLILILLSSCKTTQKLSPYDEAMKELKIGNYSVAAEKFEKIEDDQPFTKEATNGLIMSAYSYYKAKHYEDSIRVIDYFMQSNPVNENMPYMYYLKGLDYFDRIKSSSKARDLSENGRETFGTLIYRYPNSEYAEDSKIKFKTIETFLSGNELNIANFYLKRKNYIGASNHYLNILNQYPESKYVPEALYRLIEINDILNLKFEAVQYYKLLNDNFKDSDWTKYSTKIIKQYEII
ncbi:MAG TPA: outer membrane protein assembly factor BamD [Rickettsiales bacterium]|nr:outer membrane protein assembly factor BamD [Rickettsiales bacterium]